MNGCKKCVELESHVRRLEQAVEGLDLQNMPNRWEPTRGGYDFYINEEWTCFMRSEINEDVGMSAGLRKIRIDPDDERVRVRRVKDDDAILQELRDVRAELAKYNAHAHRAFGEADGCKNSERTEQ